MPALFAGEFFPRLPVLTIVPGRLNSRTAGLASDVGLRFRFFIIIVCLSVALLAVETSDISSLPFGLVLMSDLLKVCSLS